MRREVYGPHDALDLLYKAATDKLVHFELIVFALSVYRFADICDSIIARHTSQTTTRGPPGIAHTWAPTTSIRIPSHANHPIPFYRAATTAAMPHGKKDRQRTKRSTRS